MHTALLCLLYALGYFGGYVNSDDSPLWVLAGLVGLTLGHAVHWWQERRRG